MAVAVDHRWDETNSEVKILIGVAEKLTGKVFLLAAPIF